MLKNFDQSADGSPVNPRALLAMMLGALLTSSVTAVVVSPLNGLLLGLSGLSLAVIAWLYPDDGRYALRGTDDERYRSLVENADDVVTVHDDNGAITWVSASVSQFGYTPSEYARRPIADYVHRDDRVEYERLLAVVAETPALVHRAEVRVLVRDRSWRWVAIAISDRRNDPAIGGIVAHQRDVTERRLDTEIASSRVARQTGVAQLGRLALEGADPTRLATAATAIIARTLSVDTCELFRAIEGTDTLLLEAATGPSADFVDHLVLEVAPTSQAGFTALLGEAITCHDVSSESRFTVSLHAQNLGIRSGLSTIVTGQMGRYGVMVAQSRTVRTFTAEDTSFMQSVGNALALALERRTVEEEARHAALHDALTGLPNRVLFVDHLRHELEVARRGSAPVGVLFVDLDHFKVVNDSLGHGAGDALLRSVATRITATMRPGDLVARFGGDEFTILCGRLTDNSDLEKIAERVRASLEAPFDVEGNQVRMTASIGITSVDPAGDTSITADAILRDADAAMYQAKDAGRARHAMFDDSMRLQAMNRLQVEAELRAGIDRGELRLAYQPIVSMRTGHVVAVEALCRWQHPTRGLLEPADFIPIAEETDLITRLSKWVLGSAATQARVWNRDEGRGVLVTVNLSARNLERGGLLDTVAEAVDAAAIDPRWLCLEMTETTVMRDVETSMDMLWKLRETGVCVAIDDFGTGYSSLAYLKRLPVDILKIDRSFIDGVATRRDDRAIVEAIVRLAHTLGIVALGEGVEDPSQLLALRELGCDLAQGFHLSMPRPAEAIDFRPLAAVASMSDPVPEPMHPTVRT